MSRAKGTTLVGCEYVKAYPTAVRFKEMTWPRAGAYAGRLNWLLRYGTPTHSDLLAAAGIIGAYQQMVFDPENKRRVVIAGLRRAEVEDPQTEESETEAESYLYRECPGRGSCHGAMKWCSACGNVAAVCDDVGCSQHRGTP